MDDARLQRLLPLNPRTFAILAVLLEGPSHGYRIKQEVEERSAGTVTLDPGSLYRTIARLLDDGVVEQVPPPPDEAGEDERRRYYRVTTFGKELVAAEGARLDALLRRSGLRADGAA